jgi:hypothetical protein
VCPAECRIAVCLTFLVSDTLASVHRDLGPDSMQVTMTSLLTVILFTRAESCVHTGVSEECTKPLNALMADVEHSFLSLPKVNCIYPSPSSIGEYTL